MSARPGRAICLAIPVWLAGCVSLAAQAPAALPDAPTPNLAGDSTAAAVASPAQSQTGGDLWPSGANDDSEAQIEPAVYDLDPASTDGLDLLPLLGRAAQAEHAIDRESPERYHWKGLLWQSFEFFGVENSFRLMTDPYLRYLTVDKPFWHDYWASAKQWNMRRWSDGDDFLVAYVGHPMQGAITADIEVQNDPHDRFLELGDGRPYWNSRFKGFLWDTVYSTDEKIGFLGESGLGNDGGYTYVAGCQYPCPSYKPGGKYTNNTGWVKYISTPTVGTIWQVGEDFFDRYISDPIENGRPNSPWPKVLRASLTPCRTMANLLRFRLPWYRDYQHPDEVDPRAIHFLSANREAIRVLPRYELAPQFNALSLPVNTAACTACRNLVTGPGVGFAWRATPWLDLESDVASYKAASPVASYRAGGNLVVGTFGIRTGLQTPNYALKLALRPGFATYSAAQPIPLPVYTVMPNGPPAYPNAPAATPQPGRITHFVAALALEGDYGLNRHIVLRASLVNTPIRYKETYLDRPPGIGHVPFLYFISPNVYATNENWGAQAGPVLRF
jgi:hypothetical protein